MGAGLIRLLEKIDEHRSINKAAKDMKLSYVKALNLLNRLERELGCKVLLRKRGGNDKGGAELTLYGERYMREYKLLETRIRRKADREYIRFIDRLSAGPKKENPNDIKK